MPHISIRELQRNAGGVVADVAASGRPAIVTKHGRPVAAVVPISEEDLEDWVLANAPQFAADRAAADEELARGETISLDAFLATEVPAPAKTKGRRPARG